MVIYKERIYFVLYADLYGCRSDFHDTNLLGKESEISKEIGMLCHGIKLELVAGQQRQFRQFSHQSR